MKKSDYIDMRAVVYSDLTPAIIASKVSADVLAVESVPGWGWDPEDGELPAALYENPCSMADGIIFHCSAHRDSETPTLDLSLAELSEREKDLLRSMASAWNARGSRA